MTVKELIEQLKDYPADTPVYRYNSEEDRWYTDHTEEIWIVKWDDVNEIVVLN